MNVRTSDSDTSFRACGDRVGMLAEEPASPAGDLLERNSVLVRPVDDDRVLELRESGAGLADSRQLLPVVADQGARARVRDDVRALLRRAGLVDRHDDRAHRGEGVVAERPFEPGAADDRHPVASLEAQREEARREVVHLLMRRAPADLAPPALLLDEERRRVLVRAGGLPDVDDRAFRCHAWAPRVARDGRTCAR